MPVATDDDVRPYLPLAKRMAIWHCTDPRQEDDTISDAYAAVLEAVEHWDPTLGPLEPYVAYIVKRRIIDGWRTRNGRIAQRGQAASHKQRVQIASLDFILAEETGTTLMDLVPDETAPTPEESALASDTLSEALSVCHDATDAVVILALWAGLPVEARAHQGRSIADICGVTASRLSQRKKKLSRRIEAKFRPPKVQVIHTDPSGRRMCPKCLIHPLKKKPGPGRYPKMCEVCRAAG